MGLVSKEQYDYVLWKEAKNRGKKKERVEHTYVGATKEVQELLEQYESTPLKNGCSLAELNPPSGIKL